MTRTNFYQRKVVGCYLIQHRETLRSYCGQSRDILSRWKSHCSGGKKATGIAAAIRDEGVDAFIFRVLEECDVSELNEREVWWIAHYDCVEPHGWNRNSGGGAPTYVSAAARAAIGASATGKTASPETRAKMSAAAKGNTGGAGNLGKPVSSETRAKIGAAKKGKPVSSETRAKMSAAAKGNTGGAGNLGKTVSSETRAKLSSSMKGKPRSPEAIAACVEGRRRTMAARAEAAEAASYGEPLLESLQSLRTDKQYVAIAEEVKPPRASPVPSLEELDALLKEWE